MGTWVRGYVGTWALCVVHLAARADLALRLAPAHLGSLGGHAATWVGAAAGLGAGGAQIAVRLELARLDGNHPKLAAVRARLRQLVTAPGGRLSGQSTFTATREDV
jgi:hypothetical protein